MLRDEIETATSPLTSKPLWGWGRAANMAIFAFGQKRKVPGLHGTQKEVGEYALHVQCAWRITRDDQTIVGSGDLYYPSSYRDASEEVPAEFDWDHDPNLRDKLLLVLFENAEGGFVVEKVEVGKAGALHLFLSGGLCLDVLPDNSLNQEHWRLFRPGIDEPHFVFTANRVEN